MPKLLSLALPKRRVIVLDKGLMDEKQIAETLAGSSGALWYRAVVSKIEGVREENLMEASRAASTGNTLAMAGGLNAYEALTGLLSELDDYVNRMKD